MKTSDLIGPALDWAVAKCEGWEIDLSDPLWPRGWGVRGHAQQAMDNYQPSTDWSQGGPIIEREGIGLFRYNKLDPNEPDKWGAHKVVQRTDWRGDPLNVALCLDHAKPLTAAMRAFVASKLGDEVDVPKELT